MGKTVLLCAALAISAAVGLSAENPARVVRVGTAGFDFPPTLVAIDILTEAYARIGCRAEFIAFPPGRMIASLDSGGVDALILAESTFAKEHPGSIMVPVPIWTDELTVFSKRAIPVKGWESLKPLKIGYIRGMIIIEKNLAAGYNPTPAQDPAQLFRMLEADRTDAVVTSLTIGKLMISRLGLADVSRVGGTLETVPNYHFLAGKNSDIAKRLSAVLDEMEESGRIAEITAASLARLFPE